MLDLLRRWWPWLKAGLFVAVLLGVGWHFARILRSEQLRRANDARSPAEILWRETSQALPGRLVASGVLYLIGLGFCAGYWLWLVRQTGESLPAVPGVRGYYISHLGKYAPGKGWALVLRTTSAAEAGCRPTVAVLTAVYETLTTMAAGAILAGVLLLVQGASDPKLLWGAGALVLVAGIPILPGVFNRVVERLSRRFLRGSSAPLPHLRHGTLLVGLVVTTGNWVFLGASLEALLWALDPEGSGVSAAGLSLSITAVAVSYVAGFIASTPGGLGVREAILEQLLVPRVGAHAVVAVLLLRLIWTLAEVIFAAAAWWLPHRHLRPPPGEPEITTDPPPFG
jgi:uncharacterized membrane protein YbhN (UPF0104 family)